MLVLLTVAAVLAWQTAGFVSVWAIRPDLAGETRDALINVWLWPLSWLAIPVQRYFRRRREAARQARISEKVADGTYDPDWARASLHWKG